MWCFRRHTEEVCLECSPTAPVPQNHHRRLRAFCPQAPILFEPNKSPTFADKSQREYSFFATYHFCASVLAEMTVLSEAQTWRSTPFHQSMQNALEEAAAPPADIAPAGDCLRRIFEPLRFAGNVRHCRKRLMSDRASLDCIAKNLSCSRSLGRRFFFRHSLLRCPLLR